MTGTTTKVAEPAVTETVRPSGMWGRDLLSEAVAGLFARPGRTALTVLGTVIGLAALVATIGLSRTAAHQIVGRFDELAAFRPHTHSPPHTPATMPRLAITAITVLRHRSDICIPRIDANAATITSVPGRMTTDSG